MKHLEINEIDFVIPWVNGNDPEWRKRKAAATGDSFSDDSVHRYREWGLLPYWFRGIEKYAPWVRTIHFICDQDPPDWLNTNHPKLHIVRHEDYLPEIYRPAFSSHPIELNMHRIEGLSEHFVYFNDDTFLIRPTSPDAFFKKGLPVDNAIMNPVSTTDLAPWRTDDRIMYIDYNNVQYLNRRYRLTECIRRNPLKWFSPIYGMNLFRSLMLLPWPRFLGFRIDHLPQPFLKKTFLRAWETDFDILDATSRHPLRNDHDVNQWLLRMFQFAEGDFCPGIRSGKAFFDPANKDSGILNTIREQTVSMICINDSNIPETVFEKLQQEVIDAFHHILPEKSEFEK